MKSLSSSQPSSAMVTDPIETGPTKETGQKWERSKRRGWLASRLTMRKTACSKCMLPLGRIKELLFEIVNTTVPTRVTCWPSCHGSIETKPALSEASCTSGPFQAHFSTSTAAVIYIMTQPNRTDRMNHPSMIYGGSAPVESWKARLRRPNVGVCKIFLVPSSVDLSSPDLLAPNGRAIQRVIKDNVQIDLA